MPKRSKIINDPVHGFVRIPGATQFRLIEHAWFQRLRRIKQLGLTHLVYPAALHARFQHSLGAMHLMNRTLDHLVSKGHNIDAQDREDALNAILLHDIGHGPFSHTLENIIVKGLDHEQIGSAIIARINEEMDGALQGAMAILQGSHPRRFLSQLVSGQLDMDRMDYLKRDSFYTGVAEGYINLDRLMAMLDIADDELVIEAKGIFTIEHFLAARRMMYWQVYLHKTVLAAEYMLSKIMLRARNLLKENQDLASSVALKYFLTHEPETAEFIAEAAPLQHFVNLDDVDIFASLKQWQHHNDKILSLLSAGILNRRLFRIILSDQPFNHEHIDELNRKTCLEFNISPEDAMWLIIRGEITNTFYDPSKHPIKIINKDGQVTPLEAVSTYVGQRLTKQDELKYFMCYPKFD